MHILIVMRIYRHKIPFVICKENNSICYLQRKSFKVQKIIYNICFTNLIPIVMKILIPFVICKENNLKLNVIFVFTNQYRGRTPKIHYLAFSSHLSQHGEKGQGFVTD